MVSTRNLAAGASTLIWSVWLVTCALLIYHPFVQHLEFFKSPGETFYLLMLIGLPLLLIGSAGWVWLRRRGLWKREPLLFAGLAGAAALIYEPLAAATVSGIFVSAYVVGAELRERLVQEPGGPLEQLLTAFGLGAGVWIVALFSLGSLGVFHPATTMALILLPCLIRRRRLSELRSSLADVIGSWEESDIGDNAGLGVAVWFSVPLSAATMAVALAPSVAHDSLMMHLAAGRWYAERSGLDPLPTLSHSFYPQGVESLMAAAWTLADQPAAQLISPVFFVLMLASIALVGRACGCSRGAAALGVLAAGAMPFFHWSGSVAKNDAAMAFFQALACYALLRARDEDGSRWLRLCVLFTALSFSIKYTAMFGAAPIGLLWLWRLRNKSARLKEVLIAVGLFVVIMGGWQFRAFAATGNPIHPAEPSWAVESLRPNAARPPEWRSVPYWKIPWTIHFDGHNAFESPSENPSGFFLLLLLPAWLPAGVRASPAERTVLIFLGLFFLYWGSVWPVVRYALFPIGLLCALTAARWERCLASAGPGLRRALTTAVAASFAFCLMGALILSVNGPQINYFLGRIDKPEYLREALAPYSAIEALRGIADPTDYVLGIGVTSLVYVPDPSRFEVERVSRPEDALLWLPNLLRRHKYRYLVAPDSAEGDETVARLAKLLRPRQIYADGRFRIYALSQVKLQPWGSASPSPLP